MSDLFNCLEFYPGWSWWRPKSRMCWRNVHSAYICKIPECQFDLQMTQKICWNMSTLSNRQDKHKLQPHLDKPWMQPARSLVMMPLSTVSMQTFSKVWENLFDGETEHGVTVISDCTCTCSVTNRKRMSGEPTWPSLDFHPICLCAPSLWSRQRCLQWGWCWWVFPAKRRIRLETIIEVAKLFVECTTMQSI